MVRVKVCGITRVEDGLAAIDAGADALGFVFAKSPRRLAPESAAEIIAKLPPLVTKVGVFVDSELDEVRSIMSLCSLDIAQLHGNESPEFCQALFPRAIKAFRIRGPSSLEKMEGYNLRAYLLDAFNPAIVGGTGETFDWELAKEARRYGMVILAGGLTPANVRRAVEAVDPFGVDVSTGVESAPGKKDPQLVRAFIKAAKAPMV
ncbi:MAG: phosphoribosylanthranilate isomerase [Chloroflexi bacterium]|nr:phosphoribosylanthranilate isomerase [Chloroflexota bacterium]